MPKLLRKTTVKELEKRHKKRKKTLKKVARGVANLATFGLAGQAVKVGKKIVKRVSCVEKAKKSGMSQREAAHYCATGKGKKIVKGPQKIRRSKKS